MKVKGADAVNTATLRPAVLWETHTGHGGKPRSPAWLDALSSQLGDSLLTLGNSSVSSTS